MTKRKSLGTKKATTSKTTSSKTHDQPVKRTNFDLVTGGVCPHDNEKLADEVRGHGVGVSRTCEKCAHTWYLNTKIRTCKCVTCATDKRKASQSANLDTEAPILSGLRSNQLS